VSTAGQKAGDTDAAGDCPPASETCLVPTKAGGPDLTWLLHRAAQNMRTALDEAAQAHGLSGARDWMVLSALRTGPPQSQLALAQELGLDKTTMTSLLDRMEARGLVTRCTVSHDRRARIPVLTEAGSRVQAEVASARDSVEAGLLATFTPQEQHLLRDLLARLAEEAPIVHGSCI
jgi:MarR family transcriptional regulator, organic hydroperoxide resistance regulator